MWEIAIKVGLKKHILSSPYVSSATLVGTNLDFDCLPDNSLSRLAAMQ